QVDTRVGGELAHERGHVGRARRIGGCCGRNRGNGRRRGGRGSWCGSRCRSSGRRSCGCSGRRNFGNRSRLSSRRRRSGRLFDRSRLRGRCGLLCDGCGRRLRRGSSFSRGFFGGRRGGSRSTAGAVADDGERAADLDGLVFLNENLLEHSGDRRRNLGVDLVGGYLDERLVNCDLVAHLLQPPGHRALGDTLSECREVDGFTHVVLLLLEILRRLRTSLVRRCCVCQMACRGFPASARNASPRASFWVGCACSSGAMSSGYASQLTASCASPMSSPTRAPIMCTPTRGPALTRTTLIEPLVPMMWLLPLPARLKS